MNIYKIKYEFLSIFYSGIDRDIKRNDFINYEVSAGQTFRYDYKMLSYVEKIIWCFTIALQFLRSGMHISEDGIIKIELINSLNAFEKISVGDYNLTEENLLQLKCDIDEINEYLEWLNKQKNL